MQLKEIKDLEAFKQAGFSFEEIQHIQESIKKFNETGVGYSLEEVMQRVEDEVFSEARGTHV